MLLERAYPARVLPPAVAPRIGWALIALGGAQLPGTLTASLHPIVLAFTFALAILTGLVFGIIPALAVTRGNAAAFLKDDSRSGTASKGTGAKVEAGSVAARRAGYPVERPTKRRPS